MLEGCWSRVLPKALRTPILQSNKVEQPTSCTINWKPLHDSLVDEPQLIYPGNFSCLTLSLSPHTTWVTNCVSGEVSYLVGWMVFGQWEHYFPWAWGGGRQGGVCCSHCVFIVLPSSSQRISNSTLPLYTGEYW